MCREQDLNCSSGGAELEGMSCTIATEGGPVDREVARKKKSHVGIFSIRGFKGDPRQVCLVLWIWQDSVSLMEIPAVVVLIIRELLCLM